MAESVEQDLAGTIRLIDTSEFLRKILPISSRVVEAVMQRASGDWELAQCFRPYASRPNGAKAIKRSDSVERHKQNVVQRAETEKGLHNRAFVALASQVVATYHDVKDGLDEGLHLGPIRSRWMSQADGLSDNTSSTASQICPDIVNVLETSAESDEVCSLHFRYNSQSVFSWFDFES